MLCTVAVHSPVKLAGAHLICYNYGSWSHIKKNSPPDTPSPIQLESVVTQTQTIHTNNWYSSETTLRRICLVVCLTMTLLTKKIAVSNVFCFTEYSFPNGFSHCSSMYANAPL
jgi:hypothetical protein